MRLFKRNRDVGDKEQKEPAASITPTTEVVDLVEENLRYRSMRNRFVDHAPAIVTGVLFAFLVIKIPLISGGDASTTLALLSRASLVQVVVGSILVAAPFLTTGISMALLGVIRREDLRNQERYWIFANALGIIIWLSFIVSWSGLLSIFLF